MRKWEKDEILMGIMKLSRRTEQLQAEMIEIEGMVKKYEKVGDELLETAGMIRELIKKYESLS